VSANNLYFGDNLHILRNEIKAESVDLIYLDPPFNSKASYNRLFQSPNGRIPQAQTKAFKDTWRWGEQAEQEFEELFKQSNTNVSEMMQALRRFLGENDMMAYLTMMANRLLELHRVLKDPGCLYLHCDPTASHYLKIVLDGIFGNENFSNEVIWKRTTTKNDYKQGAVNWPRVHDTILMYYKKYEAAKDARRFNQPFEEYDEEYLQNFYRHTDPDGRRYRLSDLTAPGRGTRGHPQFEFLGVTRYWRHNKDKMEQLYREGRIVQAKAGGVPAFKRYLDEMPGVAAGDVWTELRPVQGIGREFLGYQTQKPLPLLERIISASSKEGDTILDPFCGCGTAIHAAEKLKRRWIGIDITHVAVGLVEDRLLAAFPGITFHVHGLPVDLDSARDLALRDKYEFQSWACSLVKAELYQGKKKGADSGIDGLKYFQDDRTMHKKIIVSVKGGEHVSVPMIRDLGHVVNREKAALGWLVTLTKPTEPMRREAVKAGYYESPIGVNFPKIQILTVEGLLNGTERPRYPDLMQGGLMSRKAEREVDAIQLGFDSAAYLSEVQTTEETPRKPARVARTEKPRKTRKKIA
jgi:DNA modification methylase